ncbi:SRPBCC family protein [Candidatus Mycobacterium wuenschmannii]|uniref:SRPBCC family protein n=1 Tax=Candidatus Mycobacterium wuenschmannii TaxID=3027808 RepID=A0ABY8VWZ3_9MYCO|nr:SRPBCC family protein [Candidatus Mycobacterium wuenschmannii]WIM88108.1 SRPBCC family protein [Candidatus Mycobacterium wuenschmannii]
MPSVSRHFSVRPSQAQVVDYLKDFAHTTEWDPGTQACTRTDSGPVAVGATWHNVSRIFGITAELTYTLKELTESRLVFVGENQSSISTDTIAVEAHGTGSTLTYRADLTMKGLAKLLNPLMKIVFEKLASDTETQLTTVLNRLATAN